jgi:hypothetical protein
MAEFHSTYGTGIDTSSVEGFWNVSGPQTLDMLPAAAKELFTNEPRAETVIVVFRTEIGTTSGYVITRDLSEGGETNEPNKHEHPGAGS